MDLWGFGGTWFNLAGATNVTDISSALDLPPVKGSNADIPMREGKYALIKDFDQRMVTLGMALQGTSIRDFETKLDALKLLFGKRTRQYLQRTLEDSSVRRALAEVNKFDVKLTSPISAKMTVDFVLAEIFFRSTIQTSDTQVISASPTLYNLTNAGNAAERAAIVTFIGTLDYPKLTNLTNGVYVGFNGAIANLVEVVVDCGAFTCKQGTTNYLNKLVHAGDAYFFKLEPGVNSLKVETNTLGGSVRIQFYPPWL